jgi:predicted DNA-binding antitoxin AbrB/MazE fold protein
MTANIKAIYENGVLRLKEALPIPEGAQVDVTVTLDEEKTEDSTGAKDPSWNGFTQLLAECAIDTGIADLSQQHDHYLYGVPKK